jgi:hypothetical protein
MIRFATAQDLFEAFPTAAQDVDAEPNDQPSLRYLQDLAEGDEPKRAVAFCAYLLPRREAVWWGCRSVRRLMPSQSAAELRLMQAAESWIEVPEEEQRIAALELGTNSNPNWASTWLALAAGWSGGNMVLGVQTPSPAPPQQTARAVRAAVLTAASRVAPQERVESLRACIEDGGRIAREEKR